MPRRPHQPAKHTAGYLRDNHVRSREISRFVDFHISGNTIMNVSEPAINFRYVGGRAHAERNTITTGSMGAAGDAIRVVGSGSFLIADNVIDCGWSDGASTGISVSGQAAPLTPEAGAIVINNDLTMSAAGEHHLCQW
jgi:hypothetical protein